MSPAGAHAPAVLLVGRSGSGARHPTATRTSAAVAGAGGVARLGRRVRSSHLYLYKRPNRTDAGDVWRHEHGGHAYAGRLVADGGDLATYTGGRAARVAAAAAGRAARVAPPAPVAGPGRRRRRSRLVLLPAPPVAARVVAGAGRGLCCCRRRSRARVAAAGATGPACRPRNRPPDYQRIDRHPPAAHPLDRGFT